MKPDMDIDEILKNYLPRASQEEADEASQTVLQRIRSMRFQASRLALERARKEPETLWLNDYLVAMLTAVEQLQGQGHPATIILRVQELMDEHVAVPPAFVNLLLMERAGLVSSSPMDPEKPNELDQAYYEITPLGKRSLAKAVALRQGVRNPLEDFA
jgi:hypothetical protein